MSRWTNWKSTRNVIPFGRRAEAVSDLAPLRQIEAYWSALCRDGQVPERAAIDPRGLENVLEYAFILERIAPGIARFRVAGQHLTGLAGMEVRGMPISALITQDSRARMAASLEHLFDAPAITELTLTGDKGRGRNRTSGQMLLLPLQSDMGDVSRALGCFVTEGGTSGQTPQRFRLGETVFRPARGIYDTPASTPVPTREFAEAQTPLAGRAPHLRLVKTGDPG